MNKVSSHVYLPAGHGLVALLLLVLVLVHLVAVLLAHPRLPLLGHLRRGLRAAVVRALLGGVVALRGVLVVQLLRAGGAVPGVRCVQHVALLVQVVHVVGGGGVVVRFVRRDHVPAVHHPGLAHVVPLPVLGEQERGVPVFVRRR